MAQQPLPVIVSIATLPSRIGDMRPTLESLLDGDLIPDKILVIVTEYSEREKCGYVIPDFLNDESFTRDVIELVVATKDWGPGTKLLGAIEHCRDECHLILADDDVSYHRNFLSAIVLSQSTRPDCSFSYYTYRVSGLTVGQGCDGFSFYSPNLDGIQSFAERNVVGTSLLYHDDLWISFFLFARSIKVKAVPTPVTGETVYSQISPNDGLSAITFGDLARDKIIYDNLPRLVSQSKLSGRKRMLLFGIRLYDVLVRYIYSSVHKSKMVIVKSGRNQAA